MKWEACRSDFEPDGSLRDIYVLGTTIKDWDTVLDWIRRTCHNVRFQLDNKEAPLPSHADAIFANRETTPLLTCARGSLTLACHFFEEQEIEFDFDPTEVRDQNGLQTLIHLILELGEIVGKVVVVTPENAQELPILRYEPDVQKVVYLPPR